MKRHNPNLLIFCLLFALLPLALSCNNDEEFAPAESFIRIYNNPSFESTYIPLDIVEAGTNGYFILSAFDKWNTYIVRVDSVGNFMWEYTLDENYVNPIPPITP